MQTFIFVGMNLIGAVAKSIYSNGRWINFGAIRDYIRGNDGYVPWPFTNIWNGTPQFNDYINDLSKLNAVLKSPALLKVFALQCDLFSLGKVYCYDSKGKELPNDPALARLNNPNPFQTRSQLLWDFMFWDMLGNAYLHVDSNVVTNERMKMYWLSPSKMEFPTDFIRQSDKMVFSDAELRRIANVQVRYKYDDGTSVYIPLSQIITITDLTNGTGNWWKGPSRISALYKIISNSEAALDAENINLRMSGKFLVAGQADPDNIKQMPMGEKEKETIETKINGGKQVHAVKSMIEIKRFVEDMGRLQLGKEYMEQYFLIGSMYGIPKDVLEAFNSSTFENQEKARAAHISYCLEPKGTDLMERLSRMWGYTDRKLFISWDHLPMVQVFERDRAEVAKKKIETMLQMLKISIPLIEINAFLDTTFTEAKYEQGRKNTGAAGQA